MKWNSLMENIKRARESDTEHLLPFDDFYNKVEVARELVKFVKSKKATKDIILESRKHLVVMGVSAMESYFQGSAQIYIDNE